MNLTNLRALAQAAITQEPSDHGKFSPTRMRIWQHALDDFHDEANPESILAMLAVIDAAKLARIHLTGYSVFDKFDRELAALDALEGDK